MRAKFAISFLLVGLSVVPATADATIVPPGNSAASQYSESVPGAGGEEFTPPGSAAAGKANDGGGAVPDAAAAELRELGPDGAAALRVAESTAPPRQAKSHGRNGTAGAAGGSGTIDASKTPQATGSSGVGEVLGGVAGTSSGGLGFLQPLILATVVLGAGAYLLRRRRAGPGSTQP